MVIYSRMDGHTCRFVGDDKVVAVKYDACLPVKVCDRESFRVQMDTDILPASDEPIGSDALTLMVDRSEGQQPLRLTALQTERLKTVD